MLNATSVTVSVSGAGSWTGTFYASSDGGNTYFTASMIRLSDRSTTTTATDTGDGQYAITNSGITHLQFRLTTWASGGANVWAIRGYGSPVASPFGSSGSGVGPFYCVDGTAAAPCYSFASGPTYGRFFAASGLQDSIAGVAKTYLGGSQFQLDANHVLEWASGAVGGAADVKLNRDAANTLALRNGTNAQTFNIYNTSSAANANYERLAAYWTGNIAVIETQKAGTGSSRDLYLRALGDLQLGGNGTVHWKINTSGNFLALNDNTYDIGAVGATRPKDIHYAGNLYGGGNVILSPGVAYSWSGRSFINSPADGEIRLSNAAGTDFSRLQFGGTTTSFPAIKRAGTALEIVLANDGGYTQLNAGILGTTGLYNVNNGNPIFIATAPTVASGGCTTPAVTWNNGTATFLITIGTSCTGVKTFTLTMPAATNRWAVDCTNNTSDAAQQSNYAVARGTSTTAVVVTSYDRVTGLQEDFTASDSYLCKASGG
jgi:hypothetical protein